jgi:penicillin-binding protein 1A
LLGRVRVTLGSVTLEGPASLSAQLAPTEWNVEIVASRDALAVLREPIRGIELSWNRTSEGGRLEASAAAAPLGRFLSVRLDERPLLDLGQIDGQLSCAARLDATSCELELAGRGVRVAALETPDDEAEAFGLPAEVSVRGSGSWRAAEGALELPSLRVSTDAATLTGSLELRDTASDPKLSLTLDVARVDFASLLGASGLSQPEAVATSPAEAPAEPGSTALGSAALGLRVAGRLSAPESFKVVQKVDFTPPSRALPALERLAGDFTHEIVEPDGSRSAIDVSPASPDFVAFGEVPPLFVQTLLVGEDAGFFGHRGVDLGELPAAILTNWARGEPARGASTITQQLARNLFLTREKRLGRKLHELCLALLLESRLSKQRILEIYLNIIEWGPRLHGLRPASRRYFGVEPAELTPRQMAFLVALIPGPRKYQGSFADGTPSPGFQRLVDNLLAKLRSLSALDEAAYQGALAEPLVIGPGTSPVELETEGRRATRPGPG